MNIPRVDIIGVQISVINMAKALAVFESWIMKGEKHYVCVTPAHSVMDCFQDHTLYPLFNSSGMTTPDGMSMAWILKLKGYQHVERVAGSDMMREILAYSVQKKWKHYFYGGAPGIPEKLAQNFKSIYPELEIAGTYSPPFRNLRLDEEQEILAQINDSQPDIVWVGISSPKQERWMAKHLSTLSASVLVGVGAAFDFLSGEKQRAPLWMQRIGMEWFYRFLTEPKRLWPRYRQYPLFVVLALAQVLGLWKPTITVGENTSPGEKRID